MNTCRPASQQEMLLLRVLLESKACARPLIHDLDSLVVKDMEDGHMGSLLLIPKGSDATERAFGKQLASAEFTDSDGTPVSVTLNVDKEGKLYELDMWKVTFAPLLQWPKVSAIKVVA